MHSEFRTDQFDEVFQFITETSGFDHTGFQNFMDDLDRHNPAFRLWADKMICQREACDKVYAHLRSSVLKNKKSGQLGMHVFRFLHFIFETYGFEKNGMEQFQKSLTQLRAYQEWRTAKTGKKHINKSHLRLVK